MSCVARSMSLIVNSDLSFLLSLSLAAAAFLPLPFQRPLPLTTGAEGASWPLPFGLVFVGAAVVATAAVASLDFVLLSSPLLLLVLAFLLGDIASFSFVYWFRPCRLAFLPPFL